MPIDRDLRRELDACRDAHVRLVGHLRTWLADDPSPERPSRLPGWTVGHVLTHLARNADSLVGMIDGAARGEVVDQYPSVEAREKDIAAGCDRRADELVDDVAASIERLEAAFERSDFEGHGRGLVVTVIALRDIPRRRQREVEYHRTDLSLGYEPEDWPADFVRRELRRQEMMAKSRIGMGMTTWPPEVRTLGDGRRLAWMVGRHSDPSLPPSPPFS